MKENFIIFPDYQLGCLCDKYQNSCSKNKSVLILLWLSIDMCCKKLSSILNLIVFLILLLDRQKVVEYYISLLKRLDFKIHSYHFKFKILQIPENYDFNHCYEFLAPCYFMLFQLWFRIYLILCQFLIIKLRQ